PIKGFKGKMSKTMLNDVLPNKKRMGMLGGLMRFYQKSGMQTVARKTGVLNVLPSQLKNMESILPKVGKPVLGNYPESVRTEGETKEKVGMLTGCIMDVMFCDVNEATIRVLNHNGFE